MRKINAGLSLLTTVILLFHSIILSVWMLSRCSIAKQETIMPWVLLVAMAIHAFISIDMAISSHAGAGKRKVKSYPKPNASTIIQRVSGVLMVLLLALHITGASNYYRPKMLHAALHPLFFMVALVHAAVSTSKALITLGIGNARVVKIVDIIVKVLCGLTFIASVVGFYLCLFMGVVK